MLIGTAVDSWYRRPPHALVPATGIDTVGSAPVPVGTLVYFGIPEVQARGTHTVQLVAARLDEVPSGVEAVSVKAARYSDTDGYIGGTDDSPSSRNVIPLPELLPVSVVRLTQGEKSPWYLIACVRVTKRGTFLVKGIVVTYRVNGRQADQRYPNQLLVNAP